MVITPKMYQTIKLNWQEVLPQLLIMYNILRNDSHLRDVVLQKGTQTKKCLVWETFQAWNVSQSVYSNYGLFFLRRRNHSRFSAISQKCHLLKWNVHRLVSIVCRLSACTSDWNNQVVPKTKYFAFNMIATFHPFFNSSISQANVQKIICSSTHGLWCIACLESHRLCQLLPIGPSNPPYAK